MQQVTPGFGLGASFGVEFESLKPKSQYGGIYEDGDNTIASTFEDGTVSVLYQKRVNPNRVHLR